MRVGPAFERSGGFICLVKYKVKNRNKVHDLRLLIARGMDDVPDPEGATALKSISLLVSLLIGLFVYTG